MKLLISNVVVRLLKYKYIFNNLAKIYISYIIKKHSKVKKVDKPRLFWGTVPIINNKYFSKAMKDFGYESSTVMSGFFDSINDKSDFDIYTDLIIKKKTLLPQFIKHLFKDFILLDYALTYYDVFHVSYIGLFLQNTQYRFSEAQILKKCNKKVIMLPFGSDFYMYSKILNSSLRHVLLMSYPNHGKNENEITSRVNYWQLHADFVVGSFMIDGASRWDNLPVNYITIDTAKWEFKNNFSEYDGHNGAVNIVHTPNHRGFKGTSFIINAIEELQKEGLKINLILLEKVKNTEVQRIFKEKADILVEQIIAIGYAVSAMEGLSTGLPVLSNLEDENYTELLRRFSYLNECPILSTTPETVKRNLRQMIENPHLREELGLAGRKYAEKYHSLKTSQYMFSKIYDKIWYDKEVDLMNMYHPLMPDSYNNQSPKIKHPLVNNNLPQSYFNKKIKS